jgi:hypothetical protein
MIIDFMWHNVKTIKNLRWRNTLEKRKYKNTKALTERLSPMPATHITSCFKRSEPATGAGLARASRAASRLQAAYFAGPPAQKSAQTRPACAQPSRPDWHLSPVPFDRTRDDASGIGHSPRW